MANSRNANAKREVYEDRYEAKDNFIIACDLLGITVEEGCKRVGITLGILKDSTAQSLGILPRYRKQIDIFIKKAFREHGVLDDNKSTNEPEVVEVPENQISLDLENEAKTDLLKSTKRKTNGTRKTITDIERGIFNLVYLAKDNDFPCTKVPSQTDIMKFLGRSVGSAGTFGKYALDEKAITEKFLMSLAGNDETKEPDELIEMLSSVYADLRIARDTTEKAFSEYSRALENANNKVIEWIKSYDKEMGLYNDLSEIIRTLTKETK